MKVKSFFTKTVNSANGQIHLQLKKRVLKKSGFKMEDLMDMDINLVPKPKVKFYKRSK